MNPKWFTFGLTQLGVLEDARTGHSNPVVDDYFDSVGFKDLTDDEAWCGAFVGKSFVIAGLEIPKIAVRARAWLDWGKEIKVPKSIDSKYDVPVGAVGVKPRAGGSGHVFMFSHWADDEHTEFYALEGNASNRVQIGKHKTSEVLGWRWPKEVQLPVANQPLKNSGIIKVSGAAIASGVAAVGGSSTEVFDAIGKAKALSTGSVIGLVFGVLVVLCVIGVIVIRARQKTNEKKIGEGL